jgi:LmbE family N-acetylglucosaminyl deacetylase
MMDTEPLIEAFTQLVGEIKMLVDGKIRGFTPYPQWAPTTRIDIRDYWEKTVDAVACHDTQVRAFLDQFKRLPEVYDASVWGYQTFYRAYSLVNSGRKIETDLFEGIFMEKPVSEQPHHFRQSRNAFLQ